MYSGGRCVAHVGTSTMIEDREVIDPSRRCGKGVVPLCARAMHRESVARKRGPYSVVGWPMMITTNENKVSLSHTHNS